MKYFCTQMKNLCRDHHPDYGDNWGNYHSTNIKEDVTSGWILEHNTGGLKGGNLADDTSDECRYPNPNKSTHGFMVAFVQNGFKGRIAGMFPYFKP